MDDTKWLDEFSSEREQNKDLSDTAKELLGSVNDPKFSNSEVSMINLSNYYYAFVFVEIRFSDWLI